MKIAFCLMSNKPDKMIQFAQHLRHGMVDGHSYRMMLSHEHFHPVILQRIANAIPPTCYFRQEARVPVFGTDGFNYSHGRLMSFRLLNGDEDYIVVVDDDLEMQPAGQFPYSSGERYMDSFRFLDSWPEYGVVFHKNRSPNDFGRNIYGSWEEYFETGYGMIIRGTSRTYRKIIADEYTVAGIGADYAMGVTALENGRRLAVAFNTPGKKGAQINGTNWRPPGSPQYKGVLGEITRKWGLVTMGGPIPERLREEYRRVAGLK